MALRFYYDPNYAPDPKGPQEGYIGDMLAGNLLAMDDRGTYTVNAPAMKAYVEALGSVPFPQQVWIVK